MAGRRVGTDDSKPARVPIEAITMPSAGRAAAALSDGLALTKLNPWVPQSRDQSFRPYNSALQRSTRRHNVGSVRLRSVWRLVAAERQGR